MCARARVCVCREHSLALTSTGPNRFMVEAASQKTGPRFKVSHDRFGEQKSNSGYLGISSTPRQNRLILTLEYCKQYFLCLNCLKLALFAIGPQIFYFEFHRTPLRYDRKYDDQEMPQSRSSGIYSSFISKNYIN